MTRAKAAKTLRTHPVIFSLSAEKKLEPMLDWLKSRMDLGDEEVLYFAVLDYRVLVCRQQRYRGGSSGYSDEQHNKLKNTTP